MSDCTAAFQLGKFHQGVASALTALTSTNAQDYVKVRHRSFTPPPPTHTVAVTRVRTPGEHIVCWSHHRVATPQALAVKTEELLKSLKSLGAEGQVSLADIRARRMNPAMESFLWGVATAEGFAKA